MDSNLNGKHEIVLQTIFFLKYARIENLYQLDEVVSQDILNALLDPSYIRWEISKNM